MRYGLHITPPCAEAIANEKNKQLKRLIAWGGALVAITGASISGYIHLVHGKEWRMLANEAGIIIAGCLLAAWAARCAAKYAFGLMQLSYAHPVSAKAYCVSANDESVQLYCMNVMKQGRQLTVGESDMLRICLATQEEQNRLATYFDEHAPITNYGRCG